MNKQELLDLTRSERSALDDIVQKLTPDELCAPVLDGDRSIKDVLAHVAKWEELMANALETGLRGETPAWPEPGATLADVDKINQRTFDENRDRPLDDIVQESRVAYERALALVESVPEEAIFTPSHFSWLGSMPLSVVVRANMDEHYHEHVTQIEAWWAGQGA